LSVRRFIDLSPILVRPVREQLEHDRVIRLLQAKYKRKSEVAINPGNQQVMPVAVGSSGWYPDLVLYAGDKNRKVIGVVEVETVESVNNLEAMSQWATFSRLRVPFHLYIPTQMVDVARRLCQDLQLTPPEIYSYQAIGDQFRWVLVQKGALGDPKGGRPAAATKPAAPAATVVTDKPIAAKATRPVAAKPTAKPTAKAVAKAAAPVQGREAARPARREAPAPPRRKAVAVKTKPKARPAKPARKASGSARAQKRR
jgi:hypothetical protein